MPTDAPTPDDHAPTARAPRVLVVGGGPAGLMAAEAARAAGCAVDLHEAKGSVGRKFLLAGKGGLNLTHAEPRPAFDARYGARAAAVGDWLDGFDAGALRAWTAALGIETFTGSSGRVFPREMKAAPLLRRWVQRLREAGVRFHVRQRWDGTLDARPGGGWTLRFATPDGPRAASADAVVLALGGASWPQLGSDGAWVPWLRARGLAVAPLEAANCGFDVRGRHPDTGGWSTHLVAHHAGAPLKPVIARWTGADGAPRERQGECVLSEYGLEGSLLYAIGADLRARLALGDPAPLALDLAPGRTREALRDALARPRGKRSLGEHLRRATGLDGAKCALLFEWLPAATLNDPAALADAIKALPVPLRAPRPVAEAISSAGGVALESLDEGLGAPALPGVCCAGEMLDWEAPTGGYLLTACFASGLRAGRTAAAAAKAAAADATPAP
jgi:uncharacterized flavoprotein (TIGR03862 family)